MPDLRVADLDAALAELARLRDEARQLRRDCQEEGNGASAEAAMYAHRADAYERACGVLRAAEVVPKVGG